MPLEACTITIPMQPERVQSKQTRYLGHLSFSTLLLYDFPGSGTQRFPTQGHYDAQELYLFDALLIVWGERLGEVEINIIRACIRNSQRFYLIRSKSDEIIRRIKDDQEIEDTVEARHIHISTTASALRGELLQAQVPDELIEEVSGYCVLVNTTNLRELSSTGNANEWPNPAERLTEIHERQLLTFLGKQGTATTLPQES
ncbi:hypothetical protein LY76DRAFT_344039 [Colletotrichum caudatum]|nr:hypothetical protein LY76DRAFT_344039 [Colletotrichum caudatum]